MNYKHVIAFLGRVQQKQWVSPAPEWVHLKDKSDSDGWGIEAEKFGAPKGGQAWSPKEIADFYFYFQRASDDIYRYVQTVETALELGASSNWDFWYNPNKKIAVVFQDSKQSSKLHPATKPLWDQSKINEALQEAYDKI